MSEKQPPKDLLLLVWVHGFKGNEVTFESFPERVSHLLQATHPSLRVESRVFPVYQTRGELIAATLAFVDWLTTLTVELENDHGAGGGAGKAKVVLMGHSMGGLLIADAALDIARNTREGDPMWPKVVAICAFDTPYLGLHPHVFKHQLSQAATYYEQAASVVTMLSPIAVGLGFGKFGAKSKPPSAAPEAPGSAAPRPPQPEVPGSKQSAVTSESASSSDTGAKSKWSLPALSNLSAPPTNVMYGLGAVALGAAAVGTMYYRREDFMNGWKWGYDHMTFVKNLWDEDGLRARLLAIPGVLEKEHNVRFWNFFTHIPPSGSFTSSRTFAILPPPSHPTYPLWRPATNTLAKDEVNAHMYMFNAKTNDGFYDLGLAVTRGIAERIEEEGVGRGWTNPDPAEGFEPPDGPVSKDGWKQEMDKDGNLVWVED